MAKLRIGQKEMESIVSVADRMAKRRHAHFVLDREKVEVIEENGSDEHPVGEPSSAHFICE
jgi:hypothetical protein